MSTHLHLDLVGGIAGDMTCAALIDAGADAERLIDALAASGLPRAAVRVDRAWRGGMAGTRFVVEPERDAPHRDWRTIRAMLDEAALPERARARALDVFARLAEAEGRVHGCAPDDVHFHEVGALDSIVDIVGASLALDQLDVTSASCGPVPICDGVVAAAHGTMPLPVPAAAELLRGFTLATIDGAIETVTPTGAALLASLCGDAPDAPRPTLRLRTVGTGMGTAELPGRANVLRALVGERLENAPADGAPAREVLVIEATIDDMDPRLFGSVREDLLAAGAHDVWTSAVQMKKSRPGTVLTVLTPPDREDALVEIVLRGTTTLGVRVQPARRRGLARRWEPVWTTYGEVRVKQGLLDGRVVTATPEYDDCERLARAAGVPVREVLTAAIVAAGATPAASPAPRPSRDPV